MVFTDDTIKEGILETVAEDLSAASEMIKNNEKSKTSYIASVRRSYLQFLFEAIGLPIRPNYWDYQYKVTFKPNKKNEISLIGLNAIDDFSFNPPKIFV